MLFFSGSHPHPHLPSPIPSPPSFEVALCLLILAAYGVNSSSTTYILLTLSSWFLALSWLFSPFIFNPSGFEWVKTVDDFTTWSQWMLYEGGVGMSSKISWEVWWEEEVVRKGNYAMHLHKQMEANIL